MIRLILFLSLFAGFTGAIQAEPTDSLFKAGNAHYTAGRYQSAVDAWETILKKGFHSPELYLNIGNGYFRLKKYAFARLYYEKAREADPLMAEPSANISIIKNFQVDNITVLPQIEIIESVRVALSVINTIPGIILLVLLSIAAVALVYRNYLLPLTGAFKAVYITILAVTLAFQFLTLTYIGLDAASDEGIVLDNRIDVRSEPAENGTTLFSIHAVTRVFIENQFEGWYFIKLENGNTGWVRQESIGVI